MINMYVCVCVCVCVCVRACVCVCVCVCVVVYNKAQAQIISNREFKFLTLLHGTESRLATFFNVEACVMSSHQSQHSYTFVNPYISS